MYRGLIMGMYCLSTVMIEVTVFVLLILPFAIFFYLSEAAICSYAALDKSGEGED